MPYICFLVGRLYLTGLYRVKMLGKICWKRLNWGGWFMISWFSKIVQERNWKLCLGRLISKNLLI